MLLSDNQIKRFSSYYGYFIEPFVSEQVNNGVVSYGLSSFGYDIRLGNNFKAISDEALKNQAVIDPKNFDPSILYDIVAGNGESVIIKPNSFVLAESFECVRVPESMLGVCIGKSTYARCGIVVNVTPLEPGWEGIITIEISNTTPLPVKVYAGEGIAQILFFQGDPPKTTYKDRKGRYQNQPGITLPFIRERD